MPIYTYQCSTCKKEHDKIRKIDQMDDSLVCSDCGGECARTVALPSEPQFKASGFTPRFYGTGGRNKKR